MNKQEILQLRKDGWSQRHIARVCGVSHMTVRRFLQAEGIATGPNYTYGPCDICKKDARLDSDHNHKTGAQRGVLCRSCNWRVGFFETQPELLVAVAAYLSKYEGKS